MTTDLSPCLRIVTAIGRSLAVLGILVAATSVACADEPPSPPNAKDIPSFRRDVMPVFFRAGCNAGTCHGASRGKDGFMLSLFGYDPKGDYERLIRERVGRRVNMSLPERSLLLLKATGAVPHTGGKLFDAQSSYYQTLRNWIAAGAPDDGAAVVETVAVTLSSPQLLFENAGAENEGTEKIDKAQQLRVLARGSDGSVRDVTELARFQSNNSSVATIDEHGLVRATGPGDTHVFARFSRFSVVAEVLVLPPQVDVPWPDLRAANFIDEHVYNRLQKLRIVPSGPADDATFLRRVTVDLTGRPPTVQEYQAFMADAGVDKRSREIDKLLATDEFTDLWTAIWAESLRVKGGVYIPDATDVKAADQFYKWIRQQLAADRPLDEFVAEMVQASGSNLRDAPSNLYTMLVHYGRFRPKEFSAEFSQLFLGVQIQCAECHNHPFDRWTQDDYYSLMSFFTGIRRKNGDEPREWITYNDPQAAPAAHLLDGRPMPARVLGGNAPVPAGRDSRVELAKWLTSADNELFRNNLANRIWAQLLGRGIVEPVDDMRVSNPPVNAPLLEALGRRLADSGFRLRPFVREICLSNTYQASLTPNASNTSDTRQFSHARMRRMRADVLLDSLLLVSDGRYQFPGFPEGTKAIHYYPRLLGDTEGPDVGDAFFQIFGRAPRTSVCSCETRSDPTLSQVLHLMVGNTISQKIADSGVVRRMVSTHSGNRDAIIDEIFIRSLCRSPTDTERKAAREHVESTPAEQSVSAYEDLLWSLMNSTEFSFNH